MFVFQVLYSAVTGPTSAVLWAMFARLGRLLRVAHRPPGHGVGLLGSRHVEQTRLGIGGPVVVWLLAMFGYQANVAQTPQALHGILLLFTMIPAAGFLLTGVGMIFYPLSEARMKELQARASDQASHGQGGTKGVNCPEQD